MESCGFRFFFLDIINIWVLFTLRVSLLASNYSAPLANSELRIWIAPSIESCWTYTVVSSAKRMNDRILLELILLLIEIRNNKGPSIEPWGTPMFRFSEEWVWFQETKCSWCNSLNSINLNKDDEFGRSFINIRNNNGPCHILLIFITFCSHKYYLIINRSSISHRYLYIIIFYSTNN